MTGAERDSRRRLERFLAHRYLSSRRGRGFLSLITLIAVGGVTVGVMALIVVIGVMSGLQRDLREKILGAEAHGMVLEIGQDVRMESWESVLGRVREDPEVTAAGPFIYTEVGLNVPGENYAEGAVLRGIQNDPEALLTTRVDELIVSGRMPFGPTESGKPGILLGAELARRLGVFPGRELAVVAFQGAELTATGIQPQMRLFEVTGTFETGLYNYDTKFSYVELEAAQRLLRLGSAVTGVEFNVTDPWQARLVGDRVEEALGFPYRVDDWQSQNRNLFSALKLEKLAMGVILLLIVLVASFNIISTLIMVVTEKVHEIGILRSMGLTAGGVMRVFMYQGTIVGLVGTVAGVTLGGTLAWLLARYEFITLPGDVYFIDRLPVDVNPVDMALIIVASLAISFLATIYPSRRAAELTPVEAIRGIYDPARVPWWRARRRHGSRSAASASRRVASTEPAGGVARVEGLHRTFVDADGHDIRVLRGVELVIDAGETIAVVGPSGAGKSTLLHLLGGLDRPTDGAVILGDRPLHELDDTELARLRNRFVGFVFQFHHLLRDFTALENVMIPQIIAGFDESTARRRALDLLDQVGLVDRAGHRPGKLSGGEQQRVAVARALANEPALLLADEPSGNLDLETSERLHHLLFELVAEHGSALVVVTHNSSLAARTGRILQLRGGVLEPAVAEPV
ncbi:MAG: ATP-binding cassette domain-containing protein [Gemmatimonadota bacterium]